MANDVRRPVVSPETVGAIAIGTTQIAGVTISGEAAIRPLMQTESMQVVYLELRAGFLHALHSHPDNESTGIVLSGRLQMRIGDDVVELGPEDVWFHPRGVPHETRALADTTAIEIHSPHRSDYVRYFA